MRPKGKVNAVKCSEGSEGTQNNDCKLARQNEMNNIGSMPKMKSWSFPEPAEGWTLLGGIGSPHRALDQARTLYILGFFWPSILMSSLSVEWLLHFIRRVEGLGKPVEFENGTKAHKDWLPIASPYYHNYFTFGHNGRPHIITVKGDKKYREQIPVMDIEIRDIEKIGYETDSISEKLSPRFPVKLFVARRNALVHFNLTAFHLIEELAAASAGIKPTAEFWRAVDRYAALDQYRRAIEFFTSTYSKLDQRFVIARNKKPMKIADESNLSELRLSQFCEDDKDRSFPRKTNKGK